MRLLHTADWHLGKLLKGVDRTPEIAAALRDLLGLVRSERVDLVVVSGDLFDRPQVSAEAEACAVEFFMELKALGVPALVIAGNHDPKERLRALAPFSGLRGPGSGAASSSPRREGWWRWAGCGRGFCPSFPSASSSGASSRRTRSCTAPTPRPCAGCWTTSKALFSWATSPWRGRGPGEGSSSSTWWEATPSPGRACLWRSATSPWATSTGNSR